MKPSSIKKLIGQPVIITWTDESGGDWPTFRVDAVVESNGLVVLTGMDDLEGNRHDGNTFLAAIDEIKTIRLRDAA